MTDALPVRINGAFWPQPVTGQQRYAREVVSHLEPQGLEVLRPPGAWASSAPRSWAWTQLRLPALASGGVLVSLTSRAPVRHPRHVVTVHDLFVLTHPEWYSRRYAGVHRPLLRRLLRTAAAIVTVSDPVRDQIRELGLTPERTPVEVAPNAAGAAFTGPAPALDLPFLAGRDVAGFFLAVGSLEPRKNLARLIAAHQLLDDETRRAYPLVLAGASAAIFAGLALPQDDRVVLAGFVSDEVLASAYRQATAVIAPSLDEGFGLPVIEALHSGARVLASDIPVFHWVAGDAAEYFDPLDVADLARVLGHALTHPPASPARAPRDYDYAVSAQVIVDLARSVG